MLKNGRGWRSPVGQTPETQRYNKCGDWHTADDVRKLRDLRIRLCSGWNSPCENCPVQCAYGVKWGEVWDYEIPENERMKIEVDVFERPSQYQRRKDAHKCVYCGKPLDKGYKLFACESCRARRAKTSREYYYEKKKVLV